MEKLIWQQTKLHCEVSVWGPGSGSLAACCGSVCPVPHHNPSIPRLPKARYPVIRPKKNGISHTLMDPWLLCPHLSTPQSPRVGGWLRCGLEELPCGAAYVFPCDPSCCLRADPAWWPPTTGPGPAVSRYLLPPNFVKLVTNLNSCSVRAPIITVKAPRCQFCPLQVDGQKQKHSSSSCW